MRKHLLVWCFVIGFAQHCQADTLEFYHVYFNESTIGKFNLWNTNDTSTTITIELSKIKELDFLRVEYFSDSYSPSYNSKLFIEDEWGVVLSEFDKKSEIYKLSIDKLRQQNNLEAGTKLCVRYFITDPDRFKMNFSLFYIDFK